MVSRNTSVTYFPYTDEGEARWDFFKQVVAFTPIKHILAVQQWDLSGANGAHFAMALFTFLYVDIVDCTATLYSMARFSGKTGPDGDFPRSTIAYCTDAAFISIGSLFGCSPSTAFIESGAGITEGGRTGLTSIVTGFCFIISVFFAPIFASIPPWATGTTLILVRLFLGLPYFALSFQNTTDTPAGRLSHDPAGDVYQLELHWRCHPIVHHDCFHAL